jgi:hypothetical protein
MNLVLPFIESADSCFTGLLGIARTLGIDCLPLQLNARTADPASELENALATSALRRPGCIAIHPTFVREWLGADQLPPPLASFLVANFPFVVVYGLDTGPMSQSIAQVLSKERLSCVREIVDVAAGYQLADDVLCGSFAGLSFGPANVHDRVLGVKPNAGAIRALISVGEAPLLAAMKERGTDIFFLAASSTIDSENDLSRRKVSDYFSQLLPISMLLRHIFQAECWRPAGDAHGTLIVDDPPLWKRYGFFDYQQLLSLMDEFEFHIAIGFIPYYWQRSSPAIVDLFRQRPDRFSICFHGNDHTQGELGTQDRGRIEYILQTAEARMQAHYELTGIPCDKVMVFPNGAFSRVALQCLKEHNFVAAVNSTYTSFTERTFPSVTELMQPSVSNYGGSPLFFRRDVQPLRAEDIAFDAFYGRPILLCEHHEGFRDMSGLVEAVSLINRVLPKIRWRNLQTSLENACLLRRKTDGSVHVRAYAMTGRITNANDFALRCAPEWSECTESWVDPAGGVEGGDTLRRQSGSRMFEVEPGRSRTFSWSGKSSLNSIAAVGPSLGAQTMVHVRRQLSEMRDNYLSKSPGLMSIAQRVHRLLLKREAPSLKIYTDSMDDGQAR